MIVSSWKLQFPQGTIYARVEVGESEEENWDVLVAKLHQLHLVPHGLQKMKIGAGTSEQQLTIYKHMEEIHVNGGREVFRIARRLAEFDLRMDELKETTKDVT